MIANRPRTIGRAGHYEVWYVTASQNGRGIWIRYTSFSPGPDSSAEPHCALWACTFDANDPTANTAAKAVFPSQSLEVQSNPFKVRISGSLLEENGCHGQLSSVFGTANWDLTWDAGRDEPFPFLEPDLGLSTVRNIGTHPRLRISGTVRTDRGAVHLDDAHGTQQHTWGTSHALEWNWGCGSGPGWWFDGATSRVRSRLGMTIQGTALGARLESLGWSQNSSLAVLRHRGVISSEQWKAVAHDGRSRLELTVTPRREDLIGVTYDDPRGGRRICYHTEVADVSLKAFESDRLVQEIAEKSCGAFEYASAHPLPGLPPRL